jgi:hypothetical protein
MKTRPTYSHKFLSDFTWCVAPLFGIGVLAHLIVFALIRCFA